MDSPIMYYALDVRRLMSTRIPGVWSQTARKAFIPQGDVTFCPEPTPRVGRASRLGAGVPSRPDCPARRPCVLLCARHPSIILRYSPDYREGEFCEVDLPIYGVLRSSLPASHAQATPKLSILGGEALRPETSWPVST